MVQLRVVCVFFFRRHKREVNFLFCQRGAHQPSSLRVRKKNQQARRGFLPTLINHSAYFNANYLSSRLQQFNPASPLFRRCRQPLYLQSPGNSRPQCDDDNNNNIVRVECSVELHTHAATACAHFDYLLGEQSGDFLWCEGACALQ